MKKNIILFAFCMLCGALMACSKQVEVGASQFDKYLPLLEGKRVALLSNQTGMVGEKHTLDVMLEHGVNVVLLFAPEHGFRGTAGAGDLIDDSVDEATGVPIASLYKGKGHKPAKEDLDKFDVLVFDIQDVGLRFYTYYIVMMQTMEALAEVGKPMVLLDRPNPNGYYVDGPVLDMKYKSGVGGLPIPVVHGMTLGELALMINGEKWLTNGIQCDLHVVPCKNYTHATPYELPIAPSPNLQNMLSIYLYPSICLFEGTPFSLGRGTDKPFLCYGHPEYKADEDRSNLFTFTPKSCTAAPRPPRMDEFCYGVDLSNMSIREARKHKFDLTWVIDAYQHSNLGEKFFTPFFIKLVGVEYIQTMIMEGKSADEIAQMWQNDVRDFQQKRAKYLIYK